MVPVQDPNLQMNAGPGPLDLENIDDLGLFASLSDSGPSLVTPAAAKSEPSAVSTFNTIAVAPNSSKERYVILDVL